MSIYIYALIILLGLSILNRYNPNRYYSHIGFLLIFIIAAFRAVEIGNDLEGYIRLFNKSQERSLLKDELEWGYRVLSDLLLQYSDEPYFFIFISSALTLIPLYGFILKKSENSSFSLFLFFILINGYGFFLTGIRQSIALVISLWAYYFFENKKYLYTTVLIIFASSFHASALFCFLFLLATFLLYNKKTMYLTLLISVFIGFMVRINIFEILPLIGVLPGFSDIVNLYSGYSDYFVDVLPNFNGLFMTIVPSTIFLYFIIKYNHHNVYSKLFFTGVVLTNIFASTPSIPRYFLYATFLQIILIPLIYSKLRRNEKYIVKGTIFLLIYYFLFISLKINGIDNYTFR